MPKAPHEGGVFGWRRYKAVRKIAGSGQREVREMRAESVARSIQMLKRILEGKAYLVVAREFGLSRSAVEQRVTGDVLGRGHFLPGRIRM